MALPQCLVCAPNYFVSGCVLVNVCMRPCTARVALSLGHTFVCVVCFVALADRKYNFGVPCGSCSFGLNRIFFECRVFVSDRPANKINQHFIVAHGLTAILHVDRFQLLQQYVRSFTRKFCRVGLRGRTCCFPLALLIRSYEQTWKCSFIFCPWSDDC